MLSKKKSIWCVMIFVLLLVGGCSKSDEASDNSVLGSAELSDFAIQVLSDGQIERVELEEAKERTIVCVEAEGFEAWFESEDNRVNHLVIEGSPNPGESEEEFDKRFEGSNNECKALYWTPIDKVWLKQSEPSEEEVQAAFITLKECVKPFGVEVSSSDSEGLRPLLERLNDSDVGEEENRELSKCFSSFSLATATAE